MELLDDSPKVAGGAMRSNTRLGLTVESVEPKSHGPGGEWDQFVRRSPRASFCHLAGWQEIIGGVLRHECVYRAAVDSDGTWQGILPMVIVRSRVFGHYLLSMPFLNYGGALGSERAKRLLTHNAVEVATHRSVDLLELRIRGGEVDSPLTPNERRVTVVLDLPDDPATLWTEVLRSKLRSQIRRPQKEGMTVRFGPEELASFYGVFARAMRDLGTPVLPRRFFERITEVFPEEAQIGCVYHDGTAVAAGCGFFWRDEFEMTWAASLKEYNRMAPNMLLYWTFMEQTIRRGGRSFNFGRCAPNSGTHRFKKQWGGKDQRLRWGQWSPQGLRQTPNPSRPLYRLGSRLWTKLPLPVAARLGPLIARQLP